MQRQETELHCLSRCEPAAELKKAPGTRRHRVTVQKRLPVSETLRVRAGARATGRKPQTRLGLAQAETVWVAQRWRGRLLEGAAGISSRPPRTCSRQADTGVCHSRGCWVEWPLGPFWPLGLLECSVTADRPEIPI